MCRHTNVLLWLLRATVLLGVLQGYTATARGSQRRWLQQTPSATQAGCDCPTSWTYSFDANRTVELSGCANPDNDPQGAWCPIDPNTCRSFTGVSENGGKAYAYDYCTKIRDVTKSGCLCRPHWFGFRSYEDESSKEYEGVCASPDGADVTPHCFVDPATCPGAVPANEKSACDGPKVAADGAVGRKVTASGCDCISFKLSAGPAKPSKVINSCSNPDNDPKGSWCVVNRTSCPTFYSSFTQDFRSVFYDYCTPVRASTNAGCLCRTAWGPGTKYKDQCANPDGKPASWCTVVPGTCVGQPAGAYDSPVWDFCEKVKGKDPDTLATGMGMEDVSSGDANIGDNGGAAPSPLPLSSNFNTSADGAPAKKKKSYFDRNLGWIIGTIVGALLLIFFIFTVRYLFCNKTEEDRQHKKGLLLPSSPSSKGSLEPGSPSISIASESPDSKYTDAVITATPKIATKQGLSFADTDKTGKADIGKESKIITVSSIDDDVLGEEKTGGKKKGDSAFDAIVKRAAEIRSKKKERAGDAKGERRLLDGEKKSADGKGKRGGSGQRADGDVEDGADAVDGQERARTGKRMESNNYATKSFNKSRTSGKPDSEGGAQKPLDWQTGMNTRRSVKVEPTDTATDLRSSVANVLHRLTGIGKKSEDSSPTTPPSATSTRPVPEPWEVYARGGTNTNTSNNTSLQTRWSQVPSSDKELLTGTGDAAADGITAQSADVSASQVSSRSSMLQSLLWLPKGKSWGMDFLQWRVPEALNKNTSADNVLKLGTIQSQDAMRVSTLPSSKANRISVSLDEMGESPAGTPAGIPPKSGTSFSRLRASSGSSEGGSARTVLDPTRRNLLGMDTPASPLGPAGATNIPASVAREANAEEPAPLAKSTTSFWNLWAGATEKSTAAQDAEGVETKPGLQMASVYASQDLGPTPPLTKSDVQVVVKEGLRASQQSHSSYSSAGTHFELRQSQGEGSPAVQLAPAQVQWPAPGLDAAPAVAHEKRVDTQLLAKLLESESSSAATPVTIGHLVGSPSSSRDCLSPGVTAAARAAAASPKFPFSMPTASMWRAASASRPTPAAATVVLPSSGPALTANQPVHMSPAQKASIHSGSQISSPAARTTAPPLPEVSALPAAAALTASSGPGSSNPITPTKPTAQPSKPDWTASWAAASLNSRVGPPVPGAPPSPATSMSIPLGHNQLKDKILAEASSPRSPTTRDLASVRALVASTASSTGSLGFSPLRERIMAAAVAAPSSAAEQPTSIYARSTTPSKTPPTGQWSRVKSSGAPAVASTREPASPGEPHAAIVTVGENVPE